MKIGILREEKIPTDSRVVFTPLQCKIIKDTYADIELFVMSCPSRCYTDMMYKDQGVEIVNNLSHCDVLIGVKEVPKVSLIAGKTYFYFSHTIKKQPYNRELLKMMMKLDITMIDYEALKDKNGKRLLGFGKYAGIVGAYNGFLTYGLKSSCYSLKPAYLCFDRKEMDHQLSNILLSNEKIIITGNGRVGKGILETVKKLSIKEVSKYDFLYNNFDEPIFVHLDTLDYNERIDGLKSDKNTFYKTPEIYRSCFMKYAKRADIFIAGHYHSSNSPYLFTREDAKNTNFNLKVIADVSCDINGPIASTIRASTISNPIYGYNPITEKEDNFLNDGNIAVMAVDNLPCELPKDSSEDFGNEMLTNIIPYLINGDCNDIIKLATICENGDLTPHYEYLREYVRI